MNDTERDEARFNDVLRQMLNTPPSKKKSAEDEDDEEKPAELDGLINN